jgi:hypothetical protein
MIVTKVSEGKNKDIRFFICSTDMENCILKRVMLLCCLGLIQQKMVSRKIPPFRKHALCIVTRSTATVKGTTTCCLDVLVRWQAGYVPFYAMDSEEITNCAK